MEIEKRLTILELQPDREYVIMGDQSRRKYRVKNQVLESKDPGAPWMINTERLLINHPMFLDRTSN
jgi:hypothetical protein